MIQTNDIARPPREWVDALQRVGAATASSTLNRMGIRNAHICGPTARTAGRAIAGPALTLQFMPKREDLYGVDEYAEPEKQLHRHALYHTQPGDIVVVDARGDMRSGVFGDMMLTFFKGKGGIGVVVDGCLRDYPNIKKLDLGLWISGVTPNFHTQTDLMPFAVNVPIACGGVLVMPGDIIVADDDGAVVVPVKLAPEAGQARVGAPRMGSLLPRAPVGGGDLRRYYPLSDAARPEYEEWMTAQMKDGQKTK